MAQLIIDIPNAVATRTTNALCEKFGYQDTINGSSNPETKAAFAKRMVAHTLKSWVIEIESNKTINTTRDTESTRLTSELNIT